MSIFYDRKKEPIKQHTVKLCKLISASERNPCKNMQKKPI